MSGAARASQEDGDIGIGVAAKPFLAVQFPAFDPIGADTDPLHLGLECADVRAAGYDRNEVAAKFGKTERWASGRLKLVHRADATRRRGPQAL